MQNIDECGFLASCFQWGFIGPNLYCSLIKSVELGKLVSNLIQTDGENCSSSCQFLDGELISGCYIWKNEEIEEHTCIWKRHPDCIRLIGENNDSH